MEYAASFNKKVAWKSLFGWVLKVGVRVMLRHIQAIVIILGSTQDLVALYHTLITDFKICHLLTIRGSRIFPLCDFILHKIHHTLSFFANARMQ